MIDQKAYMRLGAEARIREIAAELDFIRRTFPDLKTARPSVHTRAASPRAPRRRRAMTVEQRKAVSGWMRRYWAKRRAAKAGTARAK